MPTKKQHERVAEELQRQRDGGSPVDTQPEPKNDLDQPAVQERIMNPEGTPIKLSYGEIIVYPLTVREKRKATGFLAQLSADLLRVGARSADEFKLRVASLLMRREDLETELLRTVAVACFRPGSFIDDADRAQKIIPIENELREKCEAVDIHTLFDVVGDLTKVETPKA